MARMARVVIPGVPHHVTQRGVRRNDVFFIFTISCLVFEHGNGRGNCRACLYGRGS